MEFFKPDEVNIEFLAKAKTMVARAQSLGPTEAWVQSSIAWIAHVDGDYDNALKLVTGLLL